ncbi:hypothetical protein PRZ48_000630 [Zasmidium cellare]|uniref:Protein Zds1 C-terminal domain-containing protein n=1 Tax=Zasmidium cellare TaxID=395010 RepID=A0ABR0EZB3_ZASCE|nr:hypothetical protein PRZ48_000630 [Zasmidium cellare]
MQPSARQQELERLYQSRKNSKKHSPQLSISDDSHHVTEAIGSWYEQPDGHAMPPPDVREHRPLSYINSPSERESFEARRQRRHGTLIDAAGSRSGGSSPTTARTPLARNLSDERVTSPTESNGSAPSPKSLHRMSSLGSESANGQPSPPSLSRQSSTDTAVQHFPLNDIDYESSPAAVQQELSNLQAIRRMSMNIDAADPDLPSFSNIPSAAPNKDDDEDDPSKLFWVPARLHPELAPKEFKTFIEDRVDKIRRRSGDSDSLSPDGLDRSSSTSSSLRRKKSMLSHQIDTKGNYQDGAERLERKKSKGLSIDGSTTVANLADLEELVNDPSELVRRMSLDQARRSVDSGSDAGEDPPILPPANTLKRSTRTTYRRGSLKKGERVPFSRRAAQRHVDSETDESPAQSPVAQPPPEEPVILGLTRVQTEPGPPPSEQRELTSKAASRRSNRLGSSQSSEDLPTDHERRGTKSPPPLNEEPQYRQQQDEHYNERPLSQPPSQQPKQFQSRIASPGRTTAQLPGYTNNNPLPQIIETLPDGSKVPVNNLVQHIPERKSSHEVPRQFQRGGAHMRPVPGREKASSSSLDDISSHPSPLPGSGSTRTDALTMVPTFEEKKSDKKEPRKSSWKWILGNDDDKKSKDDGASDSKSGKSKLSKASADKARLDVLQNSIDGTVPARGRESLVLNREDIKLEEERKKDGKKAESKKEKEKDSGLLSALFGGKKKSSDSDLKEKKKKADRNFSPEPPPRILKPDIDYNWTRFSILEERAIYRMAHIKLANPRRALYSQVLLSNFMYSYLAKVQMMHPQMQIPSSQRAAQQKREKEQEQQPPEYNQYQRWQEQQAREEAAQSAQSSSSRTSFDMIHGGQRGDAGEESSQRGYDRRSSEEYGRQQQYSYSSQNGSGHAGHARSNGNGNGYSGGGGGSGGGSGYSVASTHDYLGYSNNQQSMWDDEERAEELW